MYHKSKFFIKEKKTVAFRANVAQLNPFAFCPSGPNATMCANKSKNENENKNKLLAIKHKL